MSKLNNHQFQQEGRASARSILSSAVIGLGAAVMLCSGSAYAAENGTGFYLLGTKGPLAAIIPAPGLYLQNDTYIYSGGTGASAQLPSGNIVSVGTKANAIIDMPSLIWSTPYKVLNGQLAFALTAPFGYQNVEADVVLGPGNFSRSGSIFTIGDPLITAMIGWNEGNFHWSVNGILNIPIGDYNENSMANVAFHRWGADISLAATWFDPASGWDISGVAGLTFNGKNLKTNYRTGTEFHFEGAISKAITPQFSLGAMGYYYQQISDDNSQSPIDLGGFRGRVAALGATASYAFEGFDRPIMARVKVLQEFHAQNRQQATSGFLSLSIPLHVDAQKAL